MDLSPYRLTIVGAMVVLILSVGVVTVLRSPADAAQYLGLVGTVAIPTLLILFRQEQTAKQVIDLHSENADKISTNSDNIEKLSSLVANELAKPEEAAKT